MKRPVDLQDNCEQQQYEGGFDEPCHKRVRLTETCCCPAELRFNHDLSELTWPQLWRGFWSLDENLTLEQRSPLQLIMTFRSTRVYIEATRSYPHVPPSVYVENGPPIHITTKEEMFYPNASMMAAFQQHQPYSVLFDRWSPTHRIGDLLNFIVQQWTGNTGQEQGTAQMEEDDTPTRLPAKHAHLFAPNRFHIGFV